MKPKQAPARPHTAALLQHDKVCFRCALPECKHLHPRCAYWGNTPIQQRYLTRVPKRYAQEKGQ